MFFFSDLCVDFVRLAFIQVGFYFNSRSYIIDELCLVSISGQTANPTQNGSMQVSIDPKDVNWKCRI